MPKRSIVRGQGVTYKSHVRVTKEAAAAIQVHLELNHEPTGEEFRLHMEEAAQRYLRGMHDNGLELVEAAKVVDARAEVEERREALEAAEEELAGLEEAEKTEEGEKQPEGDGK